MREELGIDSTAGGRDAPGRYCSPVRRRRRLPPLALGALALLGACGTGGDAAGDGGPAEASAPADGAPPADAPVAQICDGSTGIRFAFSNISPGARLTEGHALLEENGTAFFVVDGQCHFASNTAAEGWVDYHTGVLSPSAAADLARDAQYGTWAATGNHLWRGSAQDASTMSFSDGTTSLGIAGYFSTDGLPELPAALWTWQDETFASIAADGQPATGDVRYRLFTREFFDVKYPTAAWPLAADPATLAEGTDALAANDYGKGHLATGADAAALRALRRQYVQAHPGGFPTVLDFIPIGAAGGNTVPQYLLFVRDATPFESASDGLIPGLPRD